MAKILSGVTLMSILFFFSCKKDTNAQNYFIKMKIDNKDYSFSDSLFATKQSGAPKLAIFGYSKTQGQLQWLFSDFSTGAYIDTYDTSIKKVVYQFTINAIVAYYNNAPVIQMLLRPNPSAPNPISLTITSVNSQYIEGSFSGSLSNMAGISTITNGQFKVPFK